MPTFDDEKQNKKLDDLRKQEEEDLVKLLAESKYSIPYINLSTMLIENEALRAVDEKEAKEYEIAPFKVLGKNISIAIRSPEKSHVEMLTEELGKKGFTPTYYMASLSSLQKVWERYAEISFAEQSRSGGIDIDGETIIKLGERIKTLKDVEPAIAESAKDNKTHRVTRMFEIILAGAISIDASDIHIEPGENDVQVRFRLDGVLQDVTVLDKALHKLLNSRIKLLSGLKISNQAIAQDGRFSIFMNGVEISMRVSIIPGAYGESIVMRILNPKSIDVKLEDLGIPQRLYEIIMEQIKKPNGLILITGPTGSGKTTTLYAFLKKIYSTEIKVITIEDPVEYHLAGITQTQTDNEKGYTFLEGLRSALRQDPDVIMVGEIRDDETAKIAVESALTGHLVFSTLHTNNAGGVIPRLIDLSVNPKILTSALSLSMAQRLVRKLCKECKKKKVPTELEISKIKKVLNDAIAEGKNIVEYGVDMNAPIELYEAVGCDICNHTGYKGRQGIYEAILTDQQVEEIIAKNPSEREIKKTAEHQGILDMKEDGIIKVIKGITSLEEVESVVDLEED